MNCFKTGKVAKLSFLTAALLPLQAHAWPMSGQDVMMKLSSGTELGLVDKSGSSVQYAPGVVYRLRFSNKSKSFHIMSENQDHEFFVPGGFTNADGSKTDSLDNFYLKGEQYGALDRSKKALAQANAFDISVLKYERTVGQNTFNGSESCSWVCGWNRECHDETQEYRERDPRTGLERIREEVRRVCQAEPVTCYGSQSFTETDASYHTDLDLRVIDPISKSEIADFHGDAGDRTSMVSKTILSSSCAYDIPRPYGIENDQDRFDFNRNRH